MKLKQLYESKPGKMKPSRKPSDNTWQWAEEQGEIKYHWYTPNKAPPIKAAYLPGH